MVVQSFREPMMIPTRGLAPLLGIGVGESSFIVSPLRKQKTAFNFSTSFKRASYIYF
jgi:hypothetical protein